MTALLEFAAAHPVLMVVDLLAAGWALSLVVAAPFTAWRRFEHRPYDCPRCSGTGREP